MKSSNLIIIYCLCFLCSLLMLRYEKLSLEILKEETDRLEYSLDIASEKALEIFKNSIYEEKPTVPAEICFYGYFNEFMRDTGISYEKVEITWFLNEVPNPDSADLFFAKGEDSVGIYVKVIDGQLKLPIRTVGVERSLLKSVFLDESKVIK